MLDRKEHNRVQRQLRLEQYAWQNRGSLTESEARLWFALRARQLGPQFRRQVPLAGRYIADFCAPALRLVVEVDGGYHASKQQSDRRRDTVLAELGYRVVRVRAELVMRDLSAAVAVVRGALSP